MFVGFIIALAIYYSLLALWYLSRKEHSSTPPGKKNKLSSWESRIIGESSYVKRKETQVSASATVNSKPVENESIFVAETDTEPVISSALEEESSEDSSTIVIPFERLDKVFSSTPEDGMDRMVTEETEVTDFSDGPDNESDEELDEGIAGEFDYEENDEPAPNVDWEEEEERLRAYQADDDGDLNLASGVSFEELERLDLILNQPDNPMEEVAEAGTILNKISGTELFEHVLSALPDALERISKQIETQVAISRAEKKKIPEWMSFDISNYI